MSVELVLLKDLLSPVIEHFDQCVSLFRGKGFVADQPYYALLRTVEDEFGGDCRELLAGSDASQLVLADLVEFYPNRMLQFMPGWPTRRASYMACLGDVASKTRRSDLSAALKAGWATFALEANRYPDTPLPARTREGIIDAVLRDHLTRANFAPFAISIASVRKWHPRPNWVDAAVGVLPHDKADILFLAETPRPRKYELLSNFSSEPDEYGTGFDQIDLALWVVPKRQVPGLVSVAFRIRHVLFLYYWDFYSLKGLRRIMDANVAEASIILGKV